MISFKQFLFENSSGNYVSIKVENGLSIPSLEKLFGGSHVCDPKDQHVTLIYSKGTEVSKNKILDTLHQWNGKIEVELGDVTAFDATPKEGERDSSLCTIVIKLKSKTLDDIHERLKDIGLKHSYPDFSPHISILYNLPIEEKEKAISTIEKWIPGNSDVVTLRGFIVQPIKENWAESRKK